MLIHQRVGYRLADSGTPYDMSVTDIERRTMTHPAPRYSLPATASAASLLLPGLLLVLPSMTLVVYVFTGKSEHLLVSAALAIAAIPLIVNGLVMQNDLLTPLAIFGFGAILGIGLQTAYLVYSGSDGAKDLLSGSTITVLYSGLFVSLVGIVCTTVAYIMPFKFAQARSKPTSLGLFVHRNAHPNVRKMRRLSLVLCLLSAGAFSLGASRLGIDSMQDALTSRKRFVDVEGGQTVLGYQRWLTSLSSIAFILSCYTISVHQLRWRSRDGALASLALGITFAVSYTYSSRTTFMMTAVIGALTAMLVGQKRVRFRHLALLVVGAMILLNLLWGQRLVDQGRAESLQETVSVDNYVRGVVGSRDWMDVGPLSVIVERVPDRFDYQYGLSLLSPIWAPIPKTIWPDKPPVRLGPEIGGPIFGHEGFRRTGDPPGMIGELYINGGVGVVAVGMTIYGRILRRIQRLRERNTAYGNDTWDGRSDQLLYSVVVAVIALRLPSSDVAGAVITLLQMSIGVLAGLWLISSRGTRPRTPNLDSQYVG